MIGRARAVAYWITPAVLCVALYWPGLASWFQKDDFVWLALRLQVHSGHDLLRALFAPMAQGTLRTFSERAWFMLFSGLFGLTPLPFRICLVATQAANLVLLSAITAKLTGSRAAGFCAAVLWMINSNLAVPLSWASNYNQILCATCLLLSFWFWLRYLETGRARFYWTQFAVFLFGFGVLELNAIYPALAAAYMLCRARRALRRTIPLFAVSVVYSLVHFAVAPLQGSGPYQMHFDGSVVSTLWLYWKMALGPIRLILLHIYPSFWRSALAVLLMAGLIGFFGWKLCRREWLAAFFAAWFLIALAPVLPLRDHIEDSYLAVPVIGLAMWGAWALVSGWRQGWAGRVAAIGLGVIYAAVNVPLARLGAQSFYDRSQEIRRLVTGVAARHQPGKIVLLKGLDPEMFVSAVYFRPFRLYGMDEVYLVPEEEKIIGRIPEGYLAPLQVREALARRRAVVYDVRGGSVKDITDQYHVP